MSLRINHNTAAANSHRNLLQNDARLSKSLEHLSSGMKINRAGDGPAALVISEQMRGQVAGLTQAVMNSESAVALVQTAEADLQEVNRLLISMRGLAIHAANDGINDTGMLEADQAELSNAIATIDRIAQSSQFGQKSLLDGSNGMNGTASGPGLEYVKAETTTKSSPQSGYAVTVNQEATQSKIQGTVAWTPDMLDVGQVLNLQEGDKTVQVTSRVGENLAMFENRLNNEIKDAGLKIDAYFEADKLTMVHQNYGSEQKFSVISSTAGVLSQKPDTPMLIQNGLDVRGFIGDEVATGKGQILTGGEGTNVEGLAVKFTGIADPLQPEVGRVSLDSNALKFQIGGNHMQTASALIPNTSTNKLSVDVDNESGYESLRDLDVRTFQGAQDAILMIDDAVDQITSTRAELGAMQKNALESNINSLRIAKESMLNAESVIRDVDMAEEMSEFTRNQIMTQSATAMLAQANQTPNNVLSLIK